MMVMAVGDVCLNSGAVSGSGGVAVVSFERGAQGGSNGTS
jgi:hypothetical protein